MIGHGLEPPATGMLVGSSVSPPTSCARPRATPSAELIDVVTSDTSEPSRLALRIAGEPAEPLGKQGAVSSAQ